MVDHPHTPGFQRIGTTLRTDAKLTSQIPPWRPFVWFPAYTGINCPDVTFYDRLSPAYSPRRRWQCRPGPKSRARNTSVPSVCQGPYAGWNRTQPMTYNQFTCRDVTSLSVNPERSWNETETVFYSSFSTKSLCSLQWNERKKLTKHSRVSVDLNSFILWWCIRRKYMST